MVGVWFRGLVLVVLLYNSLCPFQFCNHLVDENKAGYFILIVFLLTMLFTRDGLLPLLCPNDVLSYSVYLEKAHVQHKQLLYDSY